ncbi:unnamed protein product [Rhodiola kirilowii]
MTRMDKKEGFRGVVGPGYDSLEWLLEEIPDQAAWVDYQYQDLEHEYMLLRGIFQEGSASSGFYDDEASLSGKYYCGDNRGLYSFAGDGFRNQSHGYLSIGSSGGGNGSLAGGPENGVRYQMLVDGGDLYSNSMFKPGLANLYDGRINMNEGLSGVEELSRYMSRMGVRDDGVECASELKNEDVDFYGFRLMDDPYISNDKAVYLANGGYGDFRSGYGTADAAFLGGYSSNGGGGVGLVRPAPSGFQKGHISDISFQHQCYSTRSGTSFPPMGYNTLPVGSQNVRERAPYTYHRDVPQSNFSATSKGFYKPDDIYSAPQSRLNFNGGDGILDVPNFQQVMHQNPNLNISSELQCGLSCRPRLPSNARMSQGVIQDINREGSFILQGEGMSVLSNKNVDSTTKRMKGSFNGAGGIMIKGKHTHQDRRLKMSRTYGCCQNRQTCCPVAIIHNISSLAEIRGHIYCAARDQTGCRFLQDTIEQRNPQTIQVIFDEIIKHVVELMINPFGNYFMQKLLDVCTEEQRRQITVVVTKEPGVLVRVSLNDHGTRVIQKLIETATTREQILKIVSALEIGFYALIKDSNGIHVIDRCLHCFTNEDNKFIFVAVIEYCIDIATDQSGCCVLQKCIGHSTGEYQDRLVAEISKYAFLLSQDAFGNYVVQYILNMGNSDYTSRLISQFRGNYVHLAMQKCSSHVVERCLNVSEDHRSQIIRELLSFNPFEQLLQDRHANYVIQTALKVSEGAIYRRLVEKLEPYRGMLLNSPYSKKIFSLMKKM